MSLIKSDDIKYKYICCIYDIMNHFYLEQALLLINNNKYKVKFYLNKIRYSKYSVDYDEENHSLVKKII